MDSKNKTGFVVVQDGNPRGKEVTHEDVKQGILDMYNWFTTNASDIANALKSTKGATPDEIKKLSETIKSAVPQTLEWLLSTYNGNFLLRDNYKTLSVDKILEAIDNCQVYGYWKKSYIPFAADDEQNYLCLEHDNGKEIKIVSWCADMGVIEDVEDSLGLLIERVRDGLLKKKIQYIEGAGLV